MVEPNARLGITTFHLAMAHLKNDDTQFYRNVCQELMSLAKKQRDDYHLMRATVRTLIVGPSDRRHQQTAIEWINEFQARIAPEEKSRKRFLTQARAALFLKLGSPQESVDEAASSLRDIKSDGSVITWIVLAHAMELLDENDRAEEYQEMIRAFMQATPPSRFWEAQEIEMISNQFPVLNKR